MGNDGGDIPRRKELVKEKPKVEVATSQSIAMGRARLCNFTKNPLQQPLAVCRLGHLYNYEQLLQALITKELPEKYAYIRKLSDIKKVIIERALSYSPNFIACPISKIDFNGHNQFYALWTCGHVFSKKALKEVDTENQKQCVVCQKPYNSDDLIDLNLDAAHAEWKRKCLIEKKSKKEKKPQEVKGEPRKMVKVDPHINALDRLSGQFRDVIRQRENFKGLFKKEEGDAYQKQSYNLTTTKTK